MEWKNLLLTVGIQYQSLGYEIHNALGVVERYNSFFRSVCAKVKLGSTTLSCEMALQVAVKALNDTADPTGLVPTVLLFGVFPLMQVRPKDLPAQGGHLKAMFKIFRLSHKSKLQRALLRNVLAASDLFLPVGYEYLTYRENPIGK